MVVRSAARFLDATALMTLRRGILWDGSRAQCDVPWKTILTSSRSFISPLRRRGLEPRPRAPAGIGSIMAVHDDKGINMAVAI
jgi:hypothetical protein